MTARPFPLGTEVVHADGWTGTVTGYNRGSDPIVRRSQSWQESCRAESLTVNIAKYDEDEAASIERGEQ